MLTLNRQESHFLRDWTAQDNKLEGGGINARGERGPGAHEGVSRHPRSEKFCTSSESLGEFDQVCNHPQLRQVSSTVFLYLISRRTDSSIKSQNSQDFLQLKYPYFQICFL